MKFGIGAKIITIFLGTLLCLLVVIGFLYTQKGTFLLEQELRERGEAIAKYVAHASEYAILTWNKGLLSDISNVLDQRDVVGLVVMDNEGNTLIREGNTKKNENVMEITSPVIVSRSIYLENEGVFFPEDEMDPEVIGRVAIYVSRQSAIEKMNELRRYVIVLSLFTLAISGALGVMLIRINLINPLEELFKGVSRLADGDLDFRINVHTTDELAELAEAFNTMMRSLKNHIEKRIDTAQDIIQKKNLAMLGELSSMLLHEVGNTLNRFGVIRFRLSREKLSKEGKEVLEDFENELGSLERFTRNVSFFSKKPELRLEQIELKGLLQSLVSSMRLMDQKGLKFELSLPDEPCFVMADRGIISHAFANILKNSQDASAERGRVRVYVRKSNGEVHITITDYGVGIPWENLDKIFTPFFTTKGPLGTGLGLVIAKSFIEAHGGSIEVDSHPGRTSFTVVLPIAWPS